MKKDITERNGFLFKVKAVVFVVFVLSSVFSQASEIKWDPTKSRVVCSEPHDQQTPAVSYDKKLGLIIVWQDKRPTGKKKGTKCSWSVYGKYMKQDKEFVVFSPTDSNALNPDISDKKVVFGHNRGWTNVILKELPYGKPKVIDSASSPSIDNGLIVFSSTRHRWDGWTGKGAPKASWIDDILAYETDGIGQSMDVTNSDKERQLNPDVSGRTIVWESSRAAGGWGNYGIYKRNLDTDAQPVRICKRPGKSARFPTVCSNLIVWQDNRNGNWDIYAYDLEAKKEIIICKSKGDQSAPDINGNIIVWQDNRNGNWDIYGYDLDTKIIFPVYKGKGNQTEPAVFKDAVVWTDDRNGNKDIFINTHKK